jgi:arsenate reductase
MAQAYLTRFHGDTIEVDSAGYEPADAINPLVVTVMQEDGIDLSGKSHRERLICSDKGGSTV